jgi:hypothetical protein
MTDTGQVVADPALIKQTATTCETFIQEVSDLETKLANHSQELFGTYFKSKEPAAIAQAHFDEWQQDVRKMHQSMDGIINILNQNSAAFQQAVEEQKQRISGAATSATLRNPYGDVNYAPQP